MLRDTIAASTKEAMRAKDKERLATLRLISAAIKNKDIEARASGNDGGISDNDILVVLQKMVRIRKEAIEGAKAAGRDDIIAKEKAEIAVIKAYLPSMLTQDEVAKAIDETLQSTGAASIKDIGAVMADLRCRYVGRMDFSTVAGKIKQKLQS